MHLHQGMFCMKRAQTRQNHQMTRWSKSNRKPPKAPSQFSLTLNLTLRSRQARKKQKQMLQSRMPI